MDAKTKIYNKRHKVPSIIQMEATECGAASLGMILAHYRHWIPLEDLRLECGVSRHGSNAASLLQVARKYGFEARGMRSGMPHLKEFPCPMILFWDNAHFVVLEGIVNNKYFINDPARGARKLSAEQFQKSYSGICLILQPGPQFKPSGKLPPSAFKGLIYYLKKNLWDFLYISLLALLLAIPGLIFPLLLKTFIDNIVMGEDSGGDFSGFFMVAACTTLLSGLALCWMQQIVMVRFESKIALCEGGRIFHHILRLPIQFFSQRYPGDIAHRLSSIETLASLISGAPTVSFLSLFSILAYGVAMFFYSPTMAIGVCLMAIAYLAIFIKVAKKQADISQKLVNDMGQAYGSEASNLRAIETVQASANSQFLFEHSTGYHTHIVNSSQAKNIYMSLSSILPSVTLSLLTFFILGYGGWQFSQGATSLGSLLAFQMLALNFIGPITTIVMFGGQMANSKADFSRINDVMNYPKDKRFTRQNQLNGVASFTLPDLPTKKLTGHIEICNLNFGYEKNAEPILKDFSLTIKPKQRIALVGMSGCGKSTLAQLLCGLLPPWSGQILFDGVELTHIPQAVLANSLSYVNQDIYLFDGTIRDNLNLWDTSVSEKAMLRSLSDACIDQEVNSRPDRIDAQVIGDGSNFSGGERQRLEIARALTNDPSILILDEATSALDPLVEMRLESNLRRRSCTCIVIAHRLSTIRDADHLVVLERGRIVEQGRHHQLQDTGGPYSKLLTEVEAS